MWWVRLEVQMLLASSLAPLGGPCSCRRVLRRPWLLFFVCWVQRRVSTVAVEIAVIVRAVRFSLSLSLSLSLFISTFGWHLSASLESLSLCFRGSLTHFLLDVNSRCKLKVKSKRAEAGLSHCANTRRRRRRRSRQGVWRRDVPCASFASFASFVLSFFLSFVTSRQDGGGAFYGGDRTQPDLQGQRGYLEVVTVFFSFSILISGSV